MLRWNNDYNQGAHPAILKALMDTNEISYPGYGLDEWCEKAGEEIKKYLDTDKAEVHFLLGGTQVNYTVAAVALRPYQGIVSAHTAHINNHETGAIENTGHKIHAIDGKDGKLTAEGIRAEGEQYRISGVKEHITQPKMVFLSFPSEFGTYYSLKELEDIRKACSEYNMYLYIDGARMGYGLGAASCDVKLSDIARLADAFYIGGTKCGAIFGEAVVLINDDLKDNFRSYIKQNGGMLAKGWMLGLQFYTLFKDGLYFEITRHADMAALKIKKAFADKGIPFYFENDTNQQFVILSNAQMEQIGQKHIYEYEGQYDSDHHIVRFCTSWSTRNENVDILVNDIMELNL